jgi:hypothetical protein
LRKILYKVVYHKCPNCSSYSDECIDVVHKAIYPEDEKIKCMNCNWEGKWNQLRQIQEIYVREDKREFIESKCVANCKKVELFELKFD